MNATMQTNLKPSDIMEAATKASFGKRLEQADSFYLYLGGAADET